ncbi:MAG: hypothetical protein ISS70_24935 [Phycisphaerae bacterium]|nr:hypothetical protein [Phycisphaerae bacterium]
MMPLKCGQGAARKQPGKSEPAVSEDIPGGARVDWIELNGYAATQAS